MTNKPYTPPPHRPRYSYTHRTHPKAQHLAEAGMAHEEIIGPLLHPDMTPEQRAELHDLLERANRLARAPWEEILEAEQASSPQPPACSSRGPKNTPTEHAPAVQVYTSYYGALAKLDAAGLADGTVPISRGLPRWLNEDLAVRRNILLAPSSELLRAAKAGQVEDARYTEVFSAQLAGLDPHDVLEEIRRTTGGATPVLLCWERPEDFCHRHLVADWFNAHGIEAKEWSAPTAQGVLV